MDDRQLEEIIRNLRQLEGRRYEEAAYFFVLEALDYSMFLLGKTRAQGEARHLSCDELLDGIRRYANEEFGPMAPYTFKSWGVEGTEDFGELVFQMCEIGLLNRRDEDLPEAFEDAFDFDAAFAQTSGDPT
ncbi:MAG: hypothetical protein QGH51_06760 [Planctomycetota bacterium]|jgi:uncharacterized repeat protein (TIGR04138 family)|nr:hypothetical protein [Planctomycetota bacterium]MDP6941715.1 hypothetical protein [Planctomycetota bacterium]